MFPCNVHYHVFYSFSFPPRASNIVLTGGATGLEVIREVSESAAINRKNTKFDDELASTCGNERSLGCQTRFTIAIFNRLLHVNKQKY